MKQDKAILTIFIVLLLVIMIPKNANSEWWLTDDEEEIILLRIDDGENAPKHEIDQGTYGFYDGDSEWQTVLTVNSPIVVLPPFDRQDVHWVPGPLDADENWRERWNERMEPFDQWLPEGWRTFTAAEWLDWYQDARAQNENNRDHWRQFPQWWERYGDGNN